MRHIVLVGGMASGKTSVGRIVAARLGWPLRDSDVDLAASTGHAARAIRDSQGPRALHALEARHLIDALAAAVPSVICAAASTADDAACVEALREPGLLVVWLTVSPAVAAVRFTTDSHRPWYGDEPERFLARLAQRREVAWRSLGALELASDVRAPGQLAALVLAAAAGGP